MPYINNQGVSIHYEITGEGTPLVMQHGFFSSIQDWYEFGYVENLKKVHKLIMVDARGHGASDKPHQPELYDLSNFTSDIIAVLDHLDLQKAHYFGYSMGGWIGFGMAKYTPPRLNRLIIGGAQPYGNTFSGARQILKLGIDAWVSEISEWGPYSSEDLERYRKNDAKALLAVANDRVDISNILPTMSMPCLFYAGESDWEYDLIKGSVDHVPNAKFFSLPGLSHIEAFLNGKLVSTLLIEFLTP
jgi:pimeloyl-ACP methyl ester carboxylesterase